MHENVGHLVYLVLAQVDTRREYEGGHAGPTHRHSVHFVIHPLILYACVSRVG